ncbi:TraX family protein [Neobacillus sp. YIM B06451]|uniref:TraX family protein n=1 Tax=Neobacillus sp. YIM B06451 TaxID=3070994 RepID=UPI002931B7BE|nr:TraX family protein [Neobacillus sp. YIM B06451]
MEANNTRTWTSDTISIGALDANAIKVIAIIAMIVDHTAIWLVAKGTTLDIVIHTFGRLAAPIMCYLIAEGYHYTSNLKKYKKRLFIFAVISHFPFVLFLGLEWWQATSVIWSLLMGLVALGISKREDIPLGLKIALVGVCCLLAYTADWNYIAVLWVLFFGIFRGNFKMQMTSYATIGTVFYIIPGIVSMGFDSIFRFGIFLVIPLLALYNGERGKKSKLIQWTFYVFYPAHLIILYLFRHVIFG